MIAVEFLDTVESIVSFRNYLFIYFYFGGVEKVVGKEESNAF